MVIRKEQARPKGRQHLNGTDGFWGYGKHWLDHYRSVPKSFSTLTWREISFRFNHRTEDLSPGPLILRLLQRMPTTVLA